METNNINQKLRAYKLQRDNEVYNASNFQVLENTYQLFAPNAAMVIGSDICLLCAGVILTSVAAMNYLYNLTFHPLSKEIVELETQAKTKEKVKKRK